MPVRRAGDRPSRIAKGSKRYRDDIKALGRRVRELRAMREWTLEDAAEATDVELTHLAKIEAGKVNVTMVTLVRLAVGLRVAIGDLFSREP